MTNLITKTQNIIDQDLVELADVRGQFYQKLGFLLCGVVILSAGSFLINCRKRIGEIHVLRVQRTILPGFRTFLCVELSSFPLALFDLISKPREGSTPASLLRMLVTGKGDLRIPATVAAPGIFVPFASAESLWTWWKL